MAKSSSKPTSRTAKSAKKRRTREHVIADISVNHVERLALRCGWVLQRPSPDYGYDLRLETFDDNGAIEEEQIPLQLKATDNLDQYTLARNESYSFPVSVKDYYHWKQTLMPVFLILFDAQSDEAYWLHIQSYEESEKPNIKGSTINLRIPANQILGVQTIRMMRQLKNKRVADIHSVIAEKTNDE